MCYHKYNVDVYVSLEEAVALQSHAGPRLILQVLELYYGIHREEDWTHLVVELNTLLKGTICQGLQLRTYSYF